MNQKHILAWVRQPLFMLGVILKLSLLLVLQPYASSEWYVPFMQSTLAHPSWDPWSTFIAQGGSFEAFPYGLAMFLLLLPGAGLTALLHLPLSLGYGITLLGMDMLLLWGLVTLLRLDAKAALSLYWYSPIIWIATYWFGFNDVAPVALLVLSLASLQAQRAKLSGVLLAVAVSMKLSMAIAVPFFMIYLFHNKAMRRYLTAHIIAWVSATALLSVPFLYSPAAVKMIVFNPQLQKVYDFGFDAGSGALSILSFALILMLYFAWQIRRMSFELFYVLLGLSFFLVLLLTPAAPGWFVWVVPLLVYEQARHGKMSILLVSTFTLAYIGLSICLLPPPQLLGQPIFSGWFEHLHSVLGDSFLSLFQTVLTAFGAILAFRMVRDQVYRNDYFRLSRKPWVIGIAGDSASGKDTLVESLTDLFGQHSVVSVSGDDYHLWDRHKPMWQVMTHLNPKANDLERFTQDVVSLVGRRAISVRHYDHQVGKMSRPAYLKSNDFILLKVCRLN